MAITNTTLSSALTATGDTIVVASATGAVAGAPVRIGSEFAVVSAISGTNILLKWRGSRGTIAEAHTAAAIVSFYASAADLDTPGPRQHDAQRLDVVTYNAAGAIALPVVDTLAYITASSAAALTLASPGKDCDGVWLHIISGTAAAHTVTYTAGFQNDTTTSDVATFAAKDGANILLRAFGGKWVMVNIVSAATAGAVVA
jgi:hypothetical protein